jgi:hypothetical protein
MHGMCWTASLRGSATSGTTHRLDGDTVVVWLSFWCVTVVWEPDDGVLQKFWIVKHTSWRPGPWQAAWARCHATTRQDSDTT